MPLIVMSLMTSWNSLERSCASASSADAASPHAQAPDKRSRSTPRTSGSSSTIRRRGFVFDSLILKSMGAGIYRSMLFWDELNRDVREVLDTQADAESARSLYNASWQLAN